jgi:hypothetical protein
MSYDTAADASFDRTRLRVMHGTIRPSGRLTSAGTDDRGRKRKRESTPPTDGPWAAEHARRIAALMELAEAGRPLK